MFDRHMIEHPLDICFENRNSIISLFYYSISYSIFNVERKKENQKEFLVINFMLAVNML
jgi:hypothetical protein